MNEFAPGEDVGKLRFFLRGELVEEADEWCFYEYRRIGDVTIIEDSDTFFLIYYSDAIKAGNLISTTTGRIFVSTLRDKWKNNSISREEFETKLKQLYSQHIEISEDYAIPHSSDPKQAPADWKKKYGFE